MPRPRPDPLSPREREVMRHVKRGHTDKETASEMGISHRTVSGHMDSILKRLRARSRTHALAIWLDV